MTSARLSISIVIPVYCEARHIASSLVQIRAAIEGVTDRFELIVVDDGSTDGTREILQRLAGESTALRPLFLSRNFGKEAAIRAGLEAARYDGVLVMDSDLQHPPALIPEMIRLWREEGYDVVNAVKSRRGDEASLRGLLSRLYYRIFERLAGAKLRGASDFKLIDRSVAEAYCRLPERNLFFRGLVGWMGFRQASLPFTVMARESGASKWSMPKLIALAVDSISAFSTVPLHFVTWSGCVFLVFAAVLGIQTLYHKLTGGALEGFSTVILLILITGSILMIGLGVVGLYLAKIYEEVKQRPRYLLSHPAQAEAAQERPAPPSAPAAHTRQTVRSARSTHSDA